MHVLAPELNALGVGMGGLTQFSYASRAGILAFAAAVAGTAAIDLAKADDIIETTRVRLEGLAGVKFGTQLHDGLVSMAGDIGKVAFDLNPAIEYGHQARPATRTAGPGRESSSPSSIDACRRNLDAATLDAAPLNEAWGHPIRLHSWLQDRQPPRC